VIDPDRSRGRVERLINNNNQKKEKYYERKTIRKNCRPARESPCKNDGEKQIFILAQTDWGATGIEIESGETFSGSEIMYLGLYTPIDWKTNSGPIGWIYDEGIPEAVRREMGDTPYFERIDLNDLEYLGQRK